MAKEYDPEKTGDAVVKITKTTRRKEVWYTATCKEDGWSATGETKAEAARNFAPHMGRHPGRTIRLKG